MSTKPKQTKQPPRMVWVIEYLWDGSWMPEYTLFTREEARDVARRYNDRKLFRIRKYVPES